MKKSLLIPLLALALLVPSIVSAQWVQDTTFSKGKKMIADAHGVAVDAEGKVWIQPHRGSERISVAGTTDSAKVQAIYVYNADGTEADFSPLTILSWEGDDTKKDTLGYFWDGAKYDTRTGRGIASDANGDIIASQWKTLFKFNHKNGKLLAKAEPGIGSLAEVTSDAESNIYVGPVVGADQPIIKYDSNLENPEELFTLTGSFSRDFQVSPDGNTIWWAGYTLGAVLKYVREDEFSSFNAVPDTVLRGIASEAFAIDPATGYLWVGAGSTGDLPDLDKYRPQSFYAFDVTTLGTENEAPMDSIYWNQGTMDGSYGDGKPRGIDFSDDGKIVYVALFDAGMYSVQKFEKDPSTSNEYESSSTPKGYVLSQNYPNPFNPTTNISFTLQDAGMVSIKVYDMTGREVATIANARYTAGSHQATFDASNLASGVYLYSLQANGVRLTNKMTLIK